MPASEETCVICLSRDVHDVTNPVLRLLEGVSEMPTPFIIGRAIARCNSLLEDYQDFLTAPDRGPLRLSLEKIREALDDQDKWGELDNRMHTAHHELYKICRKDEDE